MGKAWGPSPCKAGSRALPLGAGAKNKSKSETEVARPEAPLQTLTNSITEAGRVLGWAQSKVEG